MKKYFILSAAALALASCSNDEFLGNEPSGGSKDTSAAIAFGSETLNATRAGEFEHGAAAEKLNNNFIVYGFKTTYSATTTPSNNSDGADAVGDEKVFDLYNVNYTAGTNNTTESNTAGWEYVGYTPHTGSSAKEQTIKYWDYATDQYVFSAISGTGITAVKATSAVDGPAQSFATGVMTVDGTATEYDKGWEVTIPQGGSLSDLYASNRVVSKKDNGSNPSDYQKEVKLTFYNLGAKIRFAMYETVPGYSIQIDKFYKADKTSPSETNFAIEAAEKFKTLNTTGDSKLLVTYYDATNPALENRPKVTPAAGGFSDATYQLFGTNVQPTEKIGTTSAMATYDQADKSYTDIIPGNGGMMTLTVDYTLTSTDGSGETINVTGATAKVPANFTEWKANFAYTYIFKISDNTNGTTGTGSDPAGLYPITFDALVVGNEQGIQETITSVSDPSITTYQKGQVVTANDEYVAGEDIYFENSAANIADYHVYEVNNYGTEATTEEVVANWKNNFCVLTEVDVTKAPDPTAPATTTPFIPLSDGSFIEKGADQAAKFTPAAGKTYVIVSGEATDLDPTASTASGALCKVVKVAGSVATAPTYTLEATTDEITTTAGAAVYTLTSDSPETDKVVLGAKPNIKIANASGDVTTNFTITDNENGTYNIVLTAAAIAAGANGDYTVNFVKEDGSVLTTGVAGSSSTHAGKFHVNLSYALSSSPVTVVKEGTTATFTLSDGTNAISDAVIKNLPTGVTITETTTAGTYEVVATSASSAGTYTTTTVAGQALTITVDTYAFAADVTITMAQTGPSTGELVLKKNDANLAASLAWGSIGFSTDPANPSAIATVAEQADPNFGKYTITAVGGGSFVVTYENAKATVTVNQYTFTAANANIAANTGSTTLTLEKNNGTRTIENASTTKVTVKKDGAAAAAGTYKLTTNGQKLTFSNVSAPGVYTFEYTENTVLVATATVTVGEALTASATSISIAGSETSVLTYHNAAGVPTKGMTPTVNTGVSDTDWTIVDNNDGTYTFTGLVAGTYTVTIGGKNVTITVTA